MTVAPVGAFLPGDTAPKPKDAAQAAEQFEAMLLAQILKTARPEESMAEEKDSSNDTIFDLATQQFSQMLAKNGGVGLAKMIVPRLEQKP